MKFILYKMVFANGNFNYRLFFNQEEVMKGHNSATALAQAVADTIDHHIRHYSEKSAEDVSIVNLSAIRIERNQGLKEVVFIKRTPLESSEIDEFWLSLCEIYPYGKANTAAK